MKWGIALIVVLNLVVAMYGSLKQRPPVDLRAQEVSPEQLKRLPASWKPELLIADASRPAEETVLPAELSPTRAGVQANPPPAAKPEASKPVTVPVSKTEPPTSKPNTLKDPPAAPATTLACWQWGPLDDKLAARVKGALPTLKLAGHQLSQTSQDSPAKAASRYWVYYAPLATQAETQTLSSELATKGFDNYVVKNESFKGHLSLGLYSGEAAAKVLVARLKASGYGKAMIQARGNESTKKILLNFKELNNAQVEQLKALQQQLSPNLALKGCKP